MEFSFKSGSKRPRFTGIKTGVVGKRCKKNVNLSSKIVKTNAKHQANIRRDITRSATGIAQKCRWSVVCTGRSIHRVHLTVHNNSLQTVRGDTVRIVLYLIVC
jgi:hypothetical protein